ncbi:MAG: penicillin-binding protein [SAR116 cluster bacterium]|nr:penicillin-binding protein [SAR116 cluster bacterium]RPH07460.1 MAG: penicillin-binding protein 1A [Alphaproteobacteria bacterium TMED54]
MKLFTLIFTFLFFSSILILGSFFYVLWHFGRDLPDYRQLSKYEPSIVSRVHAGNGALLKEYSIERRVFVPVDVIPKKIISAFLSAEDKDFYHHFGVDLQAISRALITNFKNYGKGKRLVGASTITQQVAKNFLLSSEVSLERKIKEAILAIRIERAFTKNQILELYLNEIYLGNNSYGIAAAALNYFDKSLDDLSIDEAAFLATLPKAPSAYNPKTNYNRVFNRRNWVLNQMYKNGFLTVSNKNYLQSKEIIIKKSTGLDDTSAPYFSEEIRRKMLKDYGYNALYKGGLSIRTTLNPKLQKFADEALFRGLEKLDKRQGWRGPITNIQIKNANKKEIDAVLNKLQSGLPKNRFVSVIKNISSDKIKVYAQGKIMEIKFQNKSWLRRQIIYTDKDNNKQIGHDKKFSSFKEFLKLGDIVLIKKDNQDYILSQIPKVNGAIVVIDPNTGRVLAMTGGYQFSKSEFNRATQAFRQPGSAFKPFVYLAALDQKIKPTDIILDAPLSYDQGIGLPKWKPANYTKKFYGPSPVRLGIEKSRNLMTARLALLVSMKNIKKYGNNFGIYDNLPNLLSMSLGAGETTLLRLTTAYAMIVNGGKKISPFFIDRVQDRRGKTILKNDLRKCKNCESNNLNNQNKIPILVDERDQITDPGSAYQMVSMLRGAVTRGTGRLINKLNKTLAGKTGTTNSNQDAWFVGFSSDLAVGVFVGFDNPFTLGKRETGSSVSAPIFKDFMKKALNNKPNIPFRRPPGIKLIKVDPKTGLLSKTNSKNFIIEAFKPGQLPSKTTDFDIIDKLKEKDIVNSLSPLY